MKRALWCGDPPFASRRMGASAPCPPVRDDPGLSGDSRGPGGNAMLGSSDANRRRQDGAISACGLPCDALRWLGRPFAGYASSRARTGRPCPDRGYLQQGVGTIAPYAMRLVTCRVMIPLARNRTLRRRHARDVRRAGRLIATGRRAIAHHGPIPGGLDGYYLAPLWQQGSRCRAGRTPCADCWDRR